MMEQPSIYTNLSQLVRLICLCSSLIFEREADGPLPNAHLLVFPLQKPARPIELVSTSQEKEYGSWSLKTTCSTYKKERKEAWKPGGWRRVYEYDYAPYFYY